MFTEEQKKFLDRIILPNLVNMALHGEIPSDMNELNYSHFEDMERAKKWLASLSEDEQDGIREQLDYNNGETNWSEISQTYWEDIDNWFSSNK